MTMRIRKPGRIQAPIPSTTARPTTSTGAQLTHVGKANSTVPMAARSVNSGVSPLTVQRQGFTHPLKRNPYK